MTASIKKRRSRLSRLESNRGGKASDEEDEEVVISKKQLVYDLEIVIEASKLSSQSEAVCKQPGDTTTSETKSVQEASDATSPDARRRRSRCKTRLVDGVIPEDREEDLDGCSGDVSPTPSPAAASESKSVQEASGDSETGPFRSSRPGRPMKEQ